MPSGVEGRESLTDQIMAGLERRFLQYGHRPSPAHWKGLRAIAETIEAQASGTATPSFFLSALPTGMGKTTAVVASVKSLVSHPKYQDVGVVIFVSQLDQIRRLVDEIELAKDAYSVVLTTLS